MLRLLGLVISISVADSLNPSTVGPALFLASGRSPRRSVLEFTAGVFAVFLLGGLILTLGPGRAILALVPRPRPTTRYILETLAGAVMLLVGAVVWSRRHRLGRRSGSETSHRKQRSPVLTGAAIAAVELPTAFPYFAAIIAIVGSGHGLLYQLLMVLVYNVCFVLPLLGIVAVLVYAGDRAVEVLTGIRRYLQAHWPVLLAVLALVAGAFVTALGVTGLTSRASGRLGRLSRSLRHVLTHH